jgi:nicotinate-nucleotide adenylyltransferase
MSEGERIGILGGTLDPIHMGHVEMARAARDAMSLDRVIVVPARVPPHRQQQPHASHYHRFAMAALAINGADGFVVSDMELCAPGPSYTADTLMRLHATGLHAAQIFFITGADAFAEIETWSRYPDVLDLAHFVVVSRPGHPVADLPDRLPTLSRRLVHARSAAAISGGPTIFLVDAKTPDVSSTDIRWRLAAGERVTGLVPGPVERHIRQHGLYSSA